MLKKCKLVMLASNQKANIGDFIIIKNTGTLSDDGKIQCGFKRYEADDKFFPEQHIYVLSDDEIKVGDWIMYYHHDTRPKLYKCNDKPFTNPEWFKNESGDTVKAYKVIASTDKSLNLPSPSNAFIQKYCEMNGKIDEINVEYIEVDVTETYAGVEFYGETEVVIGYDEIPKISPDNTITIKPIKNRFNREEVVNILIKIKCTQDQVMEFIENY